jgi:putative hydrolase of the HAD superfamily
LSLFPDAYETLDRLKEVGVKLELITNGAAEAQRAKVVRFDRIIRRLSELLL